MGRGSLLIMWVHETCLALNTGNKEPLCYWEEGLTASGRTVWTRDSCQYEMINSLKMIDYSGSLKHHPGEEVLESVARTHSHISSVTEDLNESRNRTQNYKLQIKEL